jgi:hypothetical protein
MYFRADETVRIYEWREVMALRKVALLFVACLLNPTHRQECVNGRVSRIFANQQIEIHHWTLTKRAIYGTGQRSTFQQRMVDSGSIE